MTLVTCRRCGWVHFAMSRDEAQENVASFNAYYDTLSPETQADYGGRKSSIDRYEHCMQCRGDYRNFRPSVSGDCPSGCTINPIIHYDE